MKMQKCIPTLFGISLLLVFLTGCQEENGFTGEIVTEQAVINEPQSELDDNIIPGEYLLFFREDQISPILDRAVDSFSTRAEKAAFVERVEPEVIAEIDEALSDLDISTASVLQYYTTAVSGVAVKLSDDAFDRVKRSSLIGHLEYNRKVVLDPVKVEELVNLRESNGSEQIACAVQQAGGFRTVPYNAERWIWIVDSGIDMDHPDLNVVQNPKYARSFVGGSPDDCQGHGTHVAGIAAASRNGYGVIGVAAGAPVAPVKVFFGCSNEGSLNSILAGINHVAAYSLPGDVLNLSLGGYFGYGCSTYSSYKSILEQIGRSGVWISIAAGNSGHYAGYYQPACLNITRGYTVSAMNCYGYWGNLNYGIPPVDYVAVGIDVLSTYKNGRLAILTGTSMAAPVVAGILYARNSYPRTRRYVRAGNQRYRVAGI